MLYEVPPFGDEPPSPHLNHVRTMLGAVEMLKLGVTSVHDDAFYNPRATEEAIDGLMRAYVESGMRAVVTIDQPNVVEYEKYPFLQEPPPGGRPAADGGGPAAIDRGADRALHLVHRALERCVRRPARHRRLVLGAPAGHPGVPPGPVGAERTAPAPPTTSISSRRSSSGSSARRSTGSHSSAMSTTRASSPPG